ncbi:bifunctional lysylphosphatidylglycerol flippase/synthetase MprF [Ideonella benzenivorans]|uniref:bifunctional lysylphosphatidylglycerol flippase/synthetase MprF n=1 Tax=Ideonella benzenivorans TaxID=2831643 RepID=UPI001CECBCE6|nr:bifunctional lysylphosphatidylglycerol flippase/synthetase MprF [Ideonella benzenivorans]
MLAQPSSAPPAPAAASRTARWAHGWSRWRPWLLAGLGLLLAALVGEALHHLLQEVRYGQVMAAVRTTPGQNLLWSLLATVASYLALTQYDSSALRYAGAQVARGTVGLTSFVAYALSNTIGLGPLSGGAVRMRLYTHAGLEPGQIARVIGFNTAAFVLGMLAFGALGLWWGAEAVAPLLRLPAPLLQAGSLAMLGTLAGFLWLCHRQRTIVWHWGPGRRWRLGLRLPPFGLALRQLAISAVELTASGLALWFLLPESALPLFSFLALYAVAIAAALISHVPGGLGVFEAVMLLAAGPDLPTAKLLGALLLYRGLYYVLPLVLASGLLVGYELRAGTVAPMGRAAVRQSPRLLAALTLVAGLWLMVSGVTPFTRDARAVLVALNVPLPLIEASHFLGSVAGLGLLIVARGLLHRLDAAWWAALGLSLVAAVLALPKGIALNEAALLSVLAVLLVVSRRQFDRRSSLFAQHLEPEWLLGLAGVLLACVWVLFFAYKQVAYSNHLWWEFELDAQAPRSLRALTAIALLSLALGLWQLLRPRAGELPRPTAEALARAADLVQAGPRAEGCFVLMGDKRLLFSPSGRSFLMYGRQGRTWVSLFGPFGERREWPDLVWQFIELATANGGRAAFYQVRPGELPLYLDCGLQAIKLGEYAQVPLPEFSLKGGKRANLRAGVNRGEREGLSFEVVPAEAVAPLLPELQAISDAWLQQQQGREKGFSVGRFDPAYLGQLPVALVRQHGRLVAFANLQVTACKEEASIDLMRHRPEAPAGTMDFLFARIMLHLQAEGYQRFGLGMSPLAGMAERRQAPRWQRLGRLLYKYGDRFYRFRGLHSFKDKFEPQWEARYLATPGGLAPVFVLADIAALIGGGHPDDPESR